MEGTKLEERRADLTPTQTVQDFILAWSGPDIDRVCAMLSENIFYHNIPMEPLSGKAAVEEYLRAAGPFDSCTWELLHIAASGEYVLTERVDRLSLDGRHIALPIMGTFRIVRGEICEWRDYFDLAMYRSQMAGVQEDAE